MKLLQNLNYKMENRSEALGFFQEIGISMVFSDWIHWNIDQWRKHYRGEEAWWWTTMSHTNGDGSAGYVAPVLSESWEKRKTEQEEMWSYQKEIDDIVYSPRKKEWRSFSNGWNTIFTVYEGWMYNNTMSTKHHRENCIHR